MMHTHKIEEYDEDEVRDYVNDTRELAGYFNNHSVSFKSKLISDIDCYKRVLVTLRTHNCDAKAIASVEGMLEGATNVLEGLS